MNAVAAVLGAADAVAARAAVISMLDRMPARGAGVRVIAEDPLGVVGAAGRSPASSARGDHVSLVGDLRLDNGAEVRRSLGLDPGSTSAATALEAYARWGVEFAARLAGDFAFVILDPRNARAVAVRDALGIRPLYYRRGAYDLRIASELSALIDPGDAVDEGFLAEAIAGDLVDPEGTPYAAIKRLPGAHALVITAASQRLVRYWEPSTDVLSGSPSDHADRFRETFDAAVRAACAGDARVGVHLSGGLDSSSVLGSVMANAVATPVAASILLPWPDADERVWIDAAAARWSLTPILVSPPVDPAAHGLADIAVHHDLPDMPAGGPLLAPLHRALRDAGVETVLTGFGGDQWWSGESAHMADLLGRFDLAALWSWHRSGGAMGDVAWSWPAFVSSGILPHVPAAAKRLVRRVAPAPLPSCIAADFAARVGLRDRLRRRPETRHAPSESWRHLRWRLSSGEEALTKERMDRMAIAHGVELRHPLYDRRLVDLAFVTPDSARLARGRNRVVMRDAMADRLSAATRARQTKAELSQVL
ncbi:MAG: asparagine synthase-related protein, partial [Acidobacteriota bacterium]|nr:asparagine synthase-related protein [Acidobacteriota bacterium]